MIKSFEEFQSFGKENVEAYVNSATAMTKGFQSIATETADFARKSFENNAAVAEKVFAAKSIEKALEVQQGFAKDAFEAYVAQTKKVADIFTQASQEAFKPYEAKFTQAVNKAVAK